MDDNSHRYNNLTYFNKPVYFSGLGSTELMGVAVISVMAFMLPIILLKQVALSFITGPLVAAFIFSRTKRIAKRNKEGDPDALSSVQTYQAMPKNLVDSDLVIRILKNETK